MNERELLLIAVKAALMAGKEIVGVYRSNDFGVQTKGDHSPLTVADTRSNKIILKHLEITGIPVLSEESLHAPYAERRDWQRCWIVDPLDGTKEFINRNDEFTVNIALVDNGRPVAGVIFTPVTGELYVACHSTGSRKHVLEGDIPAGTDAGQIIELSLQLPVPANRSNGFTVVASRSHRTPETDDYIKALEKEHGGIRVISRGSSLKICMVAEGMADIYPRFAPTMEWDTAAGHAIAKFAGCSVTNPETGLELTYNKNNLTNPWFIIKRDV